MPFSAPSGINFRTASGITMASLRDALDAISGFLKSRDGHGYLLRFDDWLQHDGEPVPKGKLSWEGFGNRFGSEAAIAASMPKRNGVRVGICGPGMEWYLRYLADPTGGGASLDLTVPPEWEEDFLEVADSLAAVEWVRAPANEYYQSLRIGSTPLSGRIAREEARGAPRMPDLRFGKLAENISFGGNFGWLFNGKIIAAILAACVLFLAYLVLSNLYYRF